MRGLQEVNEGRHGGHHHQGPCPMLLWPSRFRYKNSPGMLRLSAAGKNLTAALHHENDADTHGDTGAEVAGADGAARSGSPARPK